MAVNPLPIQRFYGSSTETKPVNSVEGSEYFETDTFINFKWNGSRWVKKEETLGTSTETKPALGLVEGAKFLEMDTFQEFLWNGSAWVRREKIYGTSTETKPTTNIIKGSEFYEIDNSDSYFFNGTSWVRKVEPHGAEKHSEVAISISNTSDLQFMSALWSKPGRVLTNYLLTVPESTATNPTFTLSIVTSGSTAIALFTSTAHPENASHYFPFSTNNTNVVVDEGVYFNLELSTQITAASTALLAPYSNG